MDDKKIKYQYTGAGEFLTGIPARDLKEEDWGALDDEQKANVSRCGLYKEVTTKKTKE